MGLSAEREGASGILASLAGSVVKASVVRDSTTAHTPEVEFQRNERQPL